jgi:hypothetical protein
MKTPLFSFNHSHVCPEPVFATDRSSREKLNKTTSFCLLFRRREERQARKMQQELADLLGSASLLLPSSLLNSAVTVFSGCLTLALFV